MEVANPRRKRWGMISYELKFLAITNDNTDDSISIILVFSQSTTTFLEIAII
jgi:hypothetical protein